MKEETFFFAKNALVLYNGQDWPIIQREKYGDQIKKTQFDSISFSEKKIKDKKIVSPKKTLLRHSNQSRYI